MWHETPCKVKLTVGWKKLLNVKKVRYQDNFFESGGDKFLHAALKDFLEKEFLIKISDSEWNSAILFYQQIELLEKKLNYNSKKIITTFGLINSNPTIVFIHSLGGTVFAYKKIIDQLVQKYQILTIHDKFLNGDLTPYDSLQSQARFYINQLRLVNLNKELILIGHSSGGTIAFEMANQLLTTNKIHRVILLDSWVDVPLNTEVKNGFTKIMLRQVNKLKAGMFFNDYFSKEDWLEVIWHRMELLMRYKPAPVPVSASLVVAEDSIDDYKLTSSLEKLWQKYLAELQVIFTPGNHETMLDDKYLSEIINKFKKIGLDV
jgi:thioesterase domain-containing protein